MTVDVDRDVAFLTAIRRIADEVAAPNADSVDREARFPKETIDALRAEGALSAFVPARLGGGDVSFETIVRPGRLRRQSTSARLIVAPPQWLEPVFLPVG